ncbi:hypothetical protein [Streptomyces sp. NPDC050264]|uniref:hypothetical protein n=1 Tax=Streptomyces sp. NPDC050264 TaxID=3155038 RepID=UPI0034461370
MVGAPYEDVTKDGTDLHDAGAVYVIHGMPTGIGAGSKIDSCTQAQFDPSTVTEEYDRFGFAPASVTTSGGSPYPQRHRVDTEVGGHLLDRHARAAVPRDAHDILAELFRIRLGHSDILPTRPTRQASSDDLPHILGSSSGG